MVSPCPLISNSSCRFYNPLGIVSSAPITSGLTVTLVLHDFFRSLVLISLRLFSILFCCFLTITRSHVEPRSCYTSASQYPKLFFCSSFFIPFPVQNGSSSVQNGNSSVQNGNSSVQNGKIIISINIKNIL